MTEAVRVILESINRLSDDERTEAVTEVLRLAPDLVYPPLDDETLAQIADESFLMYDADEAGDAQD